MKTGTVVARFLIYGLIALGCGVHTQLLSQSPQTANGSQAKIQGTIKELQSSDPLRREAAACALKSLGSQAAPAIPALIKLLNDNTSIEPSKSCRPQTRFGNLAEGGVDVAKYSPAEAATEALVAIGAPAVTPLLEALQSSQTEARKNFVRVLAFAKDDRVIDPLIAALRDNAWQVRSEAAVALGSYKESRVVEPLIAALADQSWEVRSSAAVSLANYKDLRAVEPLIAATRDGAWQVRVDAVVALVHIRDQRAIDPLIAALRDEAWQVRMEAALGLGYVGDARALQPLNNALQDQNQKVRRQAQAALEQISRRAVAGKRP